MSHLRTLPETLEELRHFFKLEADARLEREESYDKHLSDDAQAKKDKIIDDKIAFYKAEIDRIIEDFQRFPPGHIKHAEKLKTFYEVGADYRSSVFFMTKCPEGDSESDKKLKGVIDTVSTTIAEAGFVARIAIDTDHHEWLWDNVELYLLACARAVAIVEDKYKPELNPNVAMEWGWMRGMKKSVLYLVEKDFDHKRADWEGYLQNRFSWDNPRPGVKKALKKWL